MAKKQPKENLDPLDNLIAEVDAGNVVRVIALMLWKARMENPDMTLRIVEQDIAGLEACVGYLKIEPEVRIARPQGRPAQEAIAARGRHPAIPAREAEPPRPFVVVSLVEKGTENAIRAVENNEQDYDKSQAKDAVRRARESAPTLASELIAGINSGTFSTSTMEAAAQALVTLARG